MYITHNGDLDFLDVCGVTHAVEEIQTWLERVLHIPMPAPVDSAAIAGLMDLLRTQGLWSSSVRFGCVFGRGDATTHCPVIDRPLPTVHQQQRIAALFDEVLEEVIKEQQSVGSKYLQQESSGHMQELRERVKSRVSAIASSDAIFHCLGLNEATDFQRDLTVALSSSGNSTALGNFVSCTVDAFFDNDLLHATHFFLANAKGSFGLCVSSSLDVDKEVVVAARGQTMSVAFYPSTGMVCFGSEQAAVKAGLQLENEAEVEYHNGVPAFRVDLDDLGGEGYKSFRIMECDGGYTLRGTQVQESSLLQPPFHKRKVHLQDNPLVLPIPPTVEDPVGADIAEIPHRLNKIQVGQAQRVGSDFRRGRLRSNRYDACCECLSSDGSLDCR
eukprot:gene9249-10956_t